MLPALLVIVLMPVISFAMFKFMIIPMIKAELPESGESAPITAEDIEITVDDSGTEYMVAFEPVITNLRGTNHTRFIQTIFTVYGTHPDFEVMVNEKLTRLRDVAGTILGNLTLADLERGEIKNIVRNQMREGFNHRIGKPIVEDISFSQFVVQ